MNGQTIKWLYGLAAKGGKGVVNNIDARCLGRIADKMQEANDERAQVNKAIDDAGFFLFAHVDGSFTLNRK